MRTRRFRRCTSFDCGTLGGNYVRSLSALLSGQAGACEALLKGARVEAKGASGLEDGALKIEFRKRVALLPLFP
jgi:hypothetical protein